MANHTGSDTPAQNEPAEGKAVGVVPSSQTDEKFRSQVYKPDEAHFATFDKLPDRHRLDPTKPTIAFLDDFSLTYEAAAYPNGREQPGLAHGDVSAVPAEQRGYNVLRLQPTEAGNSPLPGAGLSIQITDFGKILTNVSKEIDKGTIPLGRGDALNISMNNKLFPADFAGASKILAMNITPENLRDQVPAILKKMEKLANTPGQPQVQDVFKELVASNKAIIDMQKHGIEVVNSAGNFGPNVFDLGFLTAQTHLTGVDEKGRYYITSSRNSLSTPSLGNYELKYEPPNPNAPDQTDPAGRYKLGNLPVYFDANKFGGIHTDDLYFKRTPAGWNEMTSNPEHVQTVPAGAHVPLEPVDLGPPINYKENAVSLLIGSSFSNVDYFWNSFEQRQKLKRK
jgi:hypothetical protein